MPDGSSEDAGRAVYEPTGVYACSTLFQRLEGLEGRELLEACADVYDRLDELVAEAHGRLDTSVKSFMREGSPRALPCMEDTVKYRVVRTTMRNGREVWEDEPPGLHRH